ncbi:MAG: hypothetical protein AAB426_01235 [Myxococcota bacterium]
MSRRASSACVDPGAIAQQLGYDAWGVVLADSNPGFQPFGFADRERQAGLSCECGTLRARAWLQ